MSKLKLWLRVLLFFGIFLLINLVVGSAYVRYTRQPYVYEQSRRTFEAAREEIGILVLGDSQPLYAVNTSLIPGGYNYATKGESYILTYYKLLDAFRRSDFNPQVVVLPLSLHTFSGYRRAEVGSQDHAFWAQYMNYWEVGQAQDALPQFLLDRLKAEFPYRGGFDQVMEVWIPQEIWESSGMVAGYLPSTSLFGEDRPEEVEERAASRAAFHLEGVVYLDPLMVDYFNRLLDLLEEGGVQLVFVWYPLTEEYVEAAGEYVSVEGHLAEMQKLLAGRENVVFLDYHDLFFAHPEYFSNADHLNIAGANALTLQLIEDLAELGIEWIAPTE